MAMVRVRLYVVHQRREILFLPLFEFFKLCFDFYFVWNVLYLTTAAMGLSIQYRIYIFGPDRTGLEHS
jgi:hypothetical protein